MLWAGWMIEQRVSIDLTRPQASYINSPEPFPALVGGLGSGKSRGGTMRLIMKLVSDAGANGAYYMPTYDLLKLRAITGLEEDLTLLGLQYSVNKSDFRIDIAGLGFIILRSYDRPERIVAYEVAHSIVDELDTLPKDKAALVWRKISERNRQKRSAPNTIGIVTTPDQGLNGFVYEKWVKKAQKGYKLYKAPTTSNPYLPADYVEQIRANYDPQLAEMYINGDFVSLTANKVYHYYDRKECHTDRVITDDDTHLYIGVDFNIGGCCAVVAVIDGGDPYFVDEFVSHDTQDMVNNIAKRYPDKTVIIYPDASGKKNTTNATASDITILKSNDLLVDAPQSNPFVRDRINSVNAKLSKGTIFINSDKCPNLAHALETQGYTPLNEPEKFHVHPAIDDWADAFGYFVNRKWPLAKLNGVNGVFARSR
jgi:hypothetical protein